MIRIIHLSDFHLESSNPGASKTKLVDALLTDLKAYVNEDSILVITGDLLDKGGKGFENKSISSPFASVDTLLLKKIESTFPSLKEKIFFVPGNHDTYREKIDRITDKTLSDYIKDPDLNDLYQFVEEKITSKDFKHLERLEDFKTFERAYYEGFFDKLITNFHSSFKLSLATHRVGISCLNSSWLCKEETERGNLAIGKPQLAHSLEWIKECNVKIALVHHPLDFLHPTDSDEIKKLLHQNYDMVLHGHTHVLDSGLHQTLYGSLFISISNSTIGDNPTSRKHINGYQIIDFQPKQGFTVHYRKYVENVFKFFINNDIGEESGTRKFELPTADALENFSKAALVVDRLKKTFCEKLDTDLIIYNAGVSAPCTINSVFVQPTITNYPENSAFEEKDIIEYSIKDFTDGDGNFLIYGQKEFGKTILLDKIFLELISQFHRTNAIPVFLKFTEIKNHDVERLIKDFVHESSESTRELIRNQKFVLVIDDLSFDQRHSDILTRLKNFISKYPHVRIIATSLQQFEGKLPTDYLEHNSILQLMPIYIQSLGSKEIKQLIKNWFTDREIDFHESLEKMVKNFKSLSLPKTPLAVTLFLWIIERQEKKPINNATLVQYFVESLLQKANFENIYSDTFDFANKQRLLSHLAKFMLDHGDCDNGYSVDELNALRFTRDYLKGRFSGDHKTIIQDFTTRGILAVSDGTFLRFKSAFFFHYFLAVYMASNDEFLNYVLTDENYLDFTEELDYYTGLKRDSVKLLDFTQMKIAAVFDEMNFIVKNKPEEVDRFLESKDHMSKNFSLEKAKIKPTEKDIEESYDAELSLLPVKVKVPKKGTGRSSIQAADAVLKLAAVVLKNSEEIDDVDKKTAAYENVVVSSIAMLMLYKKSLVEYYKEYKKKPDGLPENIDMGLFIKFLPLIHQIVFYEWLGTTKLKEIFLSKMQKDKSTLNISEMEKFLTVMTYCDSRASNYTDHLSLYADNVEESYIMDAVFFKLLSYYFLRSKSKDSDHFYLKLIATVKEKLGHIDKKRKSEFIQKLEKEKQLKIFSGSGD